MSRLFTILAAFAGLAIVAQAQMLNFDNTDTDFTIIRITSDDSPMPTQQFDSYTSPMDMLSQQDNSVGMGFAPSFFSNLMTVFDGVFDSDMNDQPSFESQQQIMVTVQMPDAVDAVDDGLPPFSSMFNNLVTMINQVRGQSEAVMSLAVEYDDRQEKATCPFVRACQDDVVTFCRDAAMSQVPGLVELCLEQHLSDLSQECASMISPDGAQPAADDTHQGDDDVTHALMSCSADADRLCQDAQALMSIDSRAVQNCLEMHRDELSVPCMNLIDAIQEPTIDEAVPTIPFEAVPTVEMPLLDDTMPGPADVTTFPMEPTYTDSLDETSAIPAAPLMDEPANIPASPLVEEPAAPTTPAADEIDGLLNMCVDDLAQHCRKATDSRITAMACLHRHSHKLSQSCAAAVADKPAFHCAEDAEKLCSDATNRAEVVSCLKKHRHSISHACRHSAHKARARRAAAPTTPIDNLSMAAPTVPIAAHGDHSYLVAALALAGVVSLTATVVVVRRLRARRSQLMQQASIQTVQLVNPSVAAVHEKPVEYHFSPPTYRPMPEEEL